VSILLALMGARVANDGDVAAIRSPVYRAVLGLIIERPSYGYELVQRFERTYGDLLNLSSPSQIYTALDTLARKSLIEEMPTSLGAQGGVVRQPKPHYRATKAGELSFQQRLLARPDEDEDRWKLFVKDLERLGPQSALTVIAGNLKIYLEHSATPPLSDDRRAEAPLSLADRVAAEESRLTVGARVQLFEYMRDKFKALAAERPER
jgi:DNA-binding PadR family transcriptional regulator